MRPRHPDEGQLGPAARARGPAVSQLDADGLGIGVLLGRGASAYVVLSTDADDFGRVRVTFGWPGDSGAYAVAQMGVFRNLATALNFTVWADKAEGTRTLRGRQVDDRFGVGDQAELVVPGT
jgi:hypothetical protein